MNISKKFCSHPQGNYQKKMEMGHATDNNNGLQSNMQIKSCVYIALNTKRKKKKTNSFSLFL